MGERCIVFEMKKAVFFDRDGVLNESIICDGISCPPRDADALVVCSDAYAALPLLRRSGHLLICVTNQPDVARGTRTMDNVAEMNEKVRRDLDLDALFCCPHDTRDGCSCRKPEPGMLLEAAKCFGIDLALSWMIGDRASDILAGKRAGCHTIFLDKGPGGNHTCPDEADYTAANLIEASQYILSRHLSHKERA